MKHRKIIYYTTLFLTFLVMMAGCKKKFLDAKPNKALIVPQSLADFQALLDNALNIMNLTPYLNEMAADGFYIAPSAIVSFSETSLNAYLWKEKIYSTPSNSDWDLPFKQIFYSNVVLDELKNYEISKGEKEQINNLKGIALFHRAWALYQLAQQFTLPYNPSNAMSLPGLPIRTSSDILTPSKRANLQATYDQIKADLFEAISLLQLEQSVPTRPSKVAGYAFSARLHLVLQDYEKAKLYSDSVLALHSELIDYNTLDPLKSQPFPDNYMSKIRNPEIIFLSVLVSNTLGTDNNIRVDTTLFNLYDDQDLRKVLFFNSVGRFRGSYLAVSLYQFSGLAVDEIFLIRAECNARLGKSAAACLDLNRLLKERWVTGTFEEVQLTNSEELLEIILTERRKELIARGVRWSDLKRLNQNPKFSKTLYKKAGLEVFELKPDSKRYAFPIPDTEILASGMEQNER